MECLFTLSDIRHTLRSATLRWSLLAASLLLAAGGVIAAVPEYRTRSFFAFSRSWMRSWPFEFGHWAPETRILPLVKKLGPLVPVEAEVESGVRLALDPADFVSNALLMKGEWEPGTWKIIADHLPNGGVFIDVGAHVGYYSLKAAHRIGPTGRVIAIEPNPPTLAALQHNLKLNNASTVTVVPVACSDRETTLDFFAAAGDNTGRSSLSQASASVEHAHPTRKYTVRARRLDDIITELGLGRIDVIKLDIEGAETLALRGSTETLRKYRPALMTEIIPRQLQNMGTSEHELSQLLKDLGYSRGRQDGDNVEWVVR